jgi:hypothetical protein
MFAEARSAFLRLRSDPKFSAISAEILSDLCGFRCFQPFAKNADPS